MSHTIEDAVYAIVEENMEIEGKYMDFSRESYSLMCASRERGVFDVRRYYDNEIWQFTELLYMQALQRPMDEQKRKGLANNSNIAGEADRLKSLQCNAVQSSVEFAIKATRIRNNIYSRHVVFSVASLPSPVVNGLKVPQKFVNMYTKLVKIYKKLPKPFQKFARKLLGIR